MSEQPTQGDNVADPERIQQAEERAQTRREVELNDLRTILAMPEGRRFLWRVIGICAPMKNPFHTDPGVMAYNAGIGELGRLLLDDAMEASLEQFLIMFREGKRDDNERTRT